MIKEEEADFNKNVIREAKKIYGKDIESWKKNLEQAINESYTYLKKYPKKPSTKPESVKLLLKYGLILLEDKIYQEDFEKGREIYYYMKETLSKKEGKIILSKEVNEYKQALALRGGVLVEKSHLKQDYGHKDSEILRYYDQHIGNSPVGLEKSITVVSLLSMISGIAIGYPALTGNIIAETVNTSLGYGAILLVAGLLGVFLANKN